nr:helix-turn-helix domain-containing protein [Janibacter alkaliphilus]
MSEVSEILGISSAQAYALVRSGDLPAIKVGGRGQWRVEVDELEAYIQRMYAQTRDLVAGGEEVDAPERAPGG